MSLSTGDAESLGSMGGYTLVDRLGSGGMGVVYLGRAASGRQVAVKVVHAQYALDEEFRARFRQEVTAARRVSGAFTAAVVDADPDAELPWMATSYVPGRTLSEVVAKEGPLGGRALRTLGLGLVEALKDIHRAGLVHRDLKPSNVLMAEDGPRVIDFGISRAADNQTLTVTGRLIGTPPFMSPEQFARPRDVTGASDVFSLGSLLVYAATGNRPFDGESPYTTGYQVMHEPPILDGTPEPLRTIAERCLAKDPADRPELAELHLLLQTLPDTATVTGVPRRGPRPAPPSVPTVPATTGTGTRTGRGRRILVALAAALAVTGLSVTAVQLVSDSDTGSGKATGSASPTPGPHTAALPAGWQPWNTRLTHELGGLDPISYAEYGCVPAGTAVYCAGSGFTVAKLDAASGRVLWRHGTNPQEVRPVGVRDGLVYVYRLPDDAAAGNRVRTLVALDADTGTPKWSRRIDDNDMAARSFDGGVLTMNPDGTRFVAYGPSGAQLWTASALASGGRTCEPLVLNDAPYGLCSSGDDPNGVTQKLLRLDASDGTRDELATLPPTAESIGVVGGRFLFSVLENPNEVSQSEGDWAYAALVRVDPKTGTVGRTALSGSLRGAAALVNGAVCVVRQDGLVTAVSASTGRQLWRRATELEGLSVPVYSASYGDLYFVNHFGRLLALDGATGAERWRTSAMDDLSDSGNGTTPGVLLVRDAIVAVAGDRAFSVRPDQSAGKSAPTMGS